LWKKVLFKPGELKAVGYIGSNIAATHVRKTPGKPVRLVISPDDTVLSTGGDMTRVVVTAVDAAGQVVPQTDISVSITVNGAGEFLGESPVALEDGKTAFFIKTFDRTGIVECRAVSKTLLGAKKKIIVVN
jgi:beta-galactosidase